MKNKMRTIIIYLLVMWGFGCIGGIMLMTDKVEDLKNKYFELEKEYDILEIQYKRDLEDCQTMFGDYQDKVEAGCFVNGGWNCE